MLFSRSYINPVFLSFLRKTGLIILCIGILGLVVQYKHHPTPETSAPLDYIVHTTHLHQSLYFTGIIQPLTETAIVCPIDAVVETMYHAYGQVVQQGDMIFMLNSSAFEKQYNETLTDYLKAKDNLDIATARFNGTQELWNAGLISKNNYLSEKSSVNTTRMTFIQQTKKLTKMQEKMDDTQPHNLSSLTLAQFNKIQDILNNHHNLIHIKTPATGVLLYPPKAIDKASRINITSRVKTDQVIALIADMTGLHVDIDIPETDIHKINLGMTAHITGTALGNQKIIGKIIRIHPQAIPGHAGAAPFFNATIEVLKLSTQQSAAIKVGMSAAIELIYDQQKQIQIPIKAIRHTPDEEKYVTVQHADGRHETRHIITGAATPDHVVIEHGLHPGEHIVYHA